MTIQKIKGPLAQKASCNPVRLIGVGEWGQQVLQQLALHMLLDVAAIDSQSLSSGDPAFLTQADLLFIAFDPRQNGSLQAALKIAAHCPDELLTVVISNAPTDWPTGLPALLTLCSQDALKFLIHVVGGLATILSSHGYMGVDIEDMRTVLCASSTCAAGVGCAGAPDRGSTAAHRALAEIVANGEPLSQAIGAIALISAPPGSLKLVESRDVMNVIRQQLHRNCYLIYGTYDDRTLGADLRVTLLSASIGCPQGSSHSASFIRKMYWRRR